MQLSHVLEEPDNRLRSAGKQKASADILLYLVAASPSPKPRRDDILHLDIGLHRPAYAHHKACMVIKTNLRRTLGPFRVRYGIEFVAVEDLLSPAARRTRGRHCSLDERAQNRTIA